MGEKRGERRPLGNVLARTRVDPHALRRIVTNTTRRPLQPFGQRVMCQKLHRSRRTVGRPNRHEKDDHQNEVRGNLMSGSPKKHQHSSLQDRRKLDSKPVRNSSHCSLCHAFDDMASAAIEPTLKTGHV